jgi:hypothetical protein
MGVETGSVGCIVRSSKTVSSKLPWRIYKKHKYVEGPVTQKRKSSSGGALRVTHRDSVVGSRAEEEELGEGGGGRGRRRRETRARRSSELAVGPPPPHEPRVAEL